MSYMGKVDVKASDIKRFSVTGSTSATHALSWTAPSEQALIITINGVKQQDGAYTIAGTPTTITLSSALVATDEMEVIGINDIGQTNTVAQDSIVTDMIRDDAVTTTKIADNQITSTKIADNQVTTAKIADDQITSAKLANAINITSGNSLTIDSGATITNNGTSVGFGGSNLSAAFLETREGGYAPAGDRVFTKLDVGEASSVRHYDYASGFDNTNDRWTCPVGYAGTYLIGHGAYGRHNNGGVTYGASGVLYKNGSPLIYTYSIEQSGYNTTQTWDYYNFGPSLVQLAEGDYIEFYVAIDFASTPNFMGWKMWGFKLT